MAKVNICLVDYLDMMLIAEQKDMVGKNVVRPLTDFKVIIRRNHVFGLAFIPNSNSYCDQIQYISVNCKFHACVCVCPSRQKKARESRVSISLRASSYVYVLQYSC